MNIFQSQFGNKYENLHLPQRNIPSSLPYLNIKLFPFKLKLKTPKVGF